MPHRSWCTTTGGPRCKPLSLAVKGCMGRGTWWNYVIVVCLTPVSRVNGYTSIRGMRVVCAACERALDFQNIGYFRWWLVDLAPPGLPQVPSRTQQPGFGVRFWSAKADCKKEVVDLSNRVLASFVWPDFTTWLFSEHSLGAVAC